jgi:hypothetical protein
MLWMVPQARPCMLAFALLLAAGSCSTSSTPRDQSYGTDAGAGYQLPDAGPRDRELDAPVLDVKMDVSPDAGADGPDDAAVDGAGAD